MIQRDDIQFQSNGSACRGWLYKPSQEEKTPCVVLAHGFCGIKEMRLDAYAERFASPEAGKRQVEGARIALAENGGGNIGVEEAAMVITILQADF